MSKKLLTAAATAVVLTFAPAAVLTFAPAAAAAPPPIGGLTQLPGSAGCLTAAARGFPGCTVGLGIDGVESATVSPDGKNVYVGSYKRTAEEGLAVFARDPATGALAQLSGRSGCLSADGASALGPGTCTAVRGFGIGDGHDLVFSSDGLWAYMVNQQADAATDPPGSIIIFKRDPASGALTQLSGTAGCIDAAGSSQDGPATCQMSPEVVRPFGISISPDDRYLYVSDFGHAQHLVVFSRDEATGALAEVQCLSQQPTPSGCGSTGRVLGQDQALVISPDGLHAYSSDDFAGGGISVLDRDPATGILSQKAGTAGCISDTGSDNTGAATCAIGLVVDSPYGLVISPDGHTLYVPSQHDNGIAIFHVASDGSLSQPAGTAGCITADGRDNLGNATCATGRPLENPFGAAISPDGRTLYDVADADKPGDGIAALALDPSTGTATELPGLAGCITTDGTSEKVPGVCTAAGFPIQGPYTPGISPDGSSVYVPGYFGQSLSIFRRATGPVCQPATASPASGAPVMLAPTCADAATAMINVGAPLPSVAPPAPHGAAGTIPSLTNVTQTHRRWREPRSSGHGPVGTTFAFTLNRPARVSFTFVQQTVGRRVHGRCVVPSRNNRHRPSCARTLLRATLWLAAHSGQNRLPFTGRIPHGRSLARGGYTVAILATAAGGRSRTQMLRFSIV